MGRQATLDSLNGPNGQNGLNGDDKTCKARLADFERALITEFRGDGWDIDRLNGILADAEYAYCLSADEARSLRIAVENGAPARRRDLHRLIRRAEQYFG